MYETPEHKLHVTAKIDLNPSECAFFTCMHDEPFEVITCFSVTVLGYLEVCAPFL